MEIWPPSLHLLCMAGVGYWTTGNKKETLPKDVGTSNAAGNYDSIKLYTYT